MTSSQFRRRRPLVALLGAFLVPFLGGCDSLDGDSNSGGGPVVPGQGGLGAGLGDPGEELPLGNGLTVFIDPNDNGSASRVHVGEIFWGRLVDIYDRKSGTETLRHRAYVIGQDIRDETTVDTDDDPFTPEEPIYTLATDPVTEVVKLTIGAAKGTLAYNQAFTRLHAGLEAVNSASPGGIGPFSLVARNGTMVIRTDDLLDPATIIEGQSVLIRTGNPPSSPFRARVFPDPNFGQVFRDVDGNGVDEFRPTRILIDFTVSEAELAQTNANGPNNVGLPASPTQQQANVAVLLPTATESGGGVFILARNLAGQSFEALPQGPQVDSGSGSLPLVIGFRSGGANDAYNGFMNDFKPPTILASLNVDVSNVRCNDGSSCDFDPSFRYRIDLEYADPLCETIAPQEGDLLEMPNGILARVLSDAGPAVAGVFTNVRVRDITQKFTFPRDTDGAEALLLAPYEPLEGDAAAAACFLTFSPKPKILPNQQVDPNSTISLRFSEPMDPASISALEDMLVLRVAGETAPEDIVVGNMLPSDDLTSFSYKPVLPFSHTNGMSESYFVSIGQRPNGLADLAGNRVVDLLPDLLEFTLDPIAESDTNGGFVLRFNEADLDEDPAPTGGMKDCFGPEISGQFLFDPVAGTIRARPVTRYSMVVDRDQPTISSMAGLPIDPNLLFGIGPTIYDNRTQEPMVGTVGSRTMAMWRYCDMGMSVNGSAPNGLSIDLEDEALYNVDVEGISWAAVGSVNVDRFDQFEIALAHAARFPDEAYIPPPVGAPTRADTFFGGDSGMVPTNFADNALADGSDEGLTVVHDRNLGYTVNPLDAFDASTGSLMMPYPLNQGSDPNTYRYYTWRDTALQALGGAPSIGITPVFAGGAFFYQIGLGVPPKILLQLSDPSGPAIDWQPIFDPNDDIYFPSLLGYAAPLDSSVSFAWQGGIPSVAMPLLMDFRCFPDSGAGNNLPDVSIAGFPTVFFSVDAPVDFRLTSTGGIDVNGQTRKVNPDPQLTPNPTGGYNSNSATGPGIPFGAPTPASDSIVYLGQLDLVTRISRVYTRWFDTRGGNVRFLAPVIVPAPEDQPSGTSIQFDYRQADSVNIVASCTFQDDAFGGSDDGFEGKVLYIVPPGPAQTSSFLDAYGDERALKDHGNEVFESPAPRLRNTHFVPYGDPTLRNASVEFIGGDETWTSDRDDLDGAPFLQTRMTFVANPQSGVTPELTAVGWVYDFAD